MRIRSAVPAVIRVEVLEREIDALIRHGLIDAERRADRGEIRAALHQAGSCSRAGRRRH